MEDSVELFDALIRSGARRLTGYQRRSFQAEVAVELCSGNARQAERRFGWGRETVEKGLYERQTGLRCLEDFVARGRRILRLVESGRSDRVRSPGAWHVPNPGACRKHLGSRNGLANSRRGMPTMSRRPCRPVHGPTAAARGGSR